jgi:CubicO group peptidase (beta-lactamase class C family)
LYSNIVQSVAVPLIEKLSGKSYDQYVRETIFQPLGMECSVFSAEEAGDDLAMGYQAIHTECGTDDHLLEVKHSLDRLGGSFGMSCSRLITTITDMVSSPDLDLLTTRAKLLAHIREHSTFESLNKPLNKCKYEEGKLFQEQFYGTGTVSFMLGDHVFSGHHGECAGFRAHLMRVRSLNCGMAVLTNSGEGNYLIKWIEAWVVSRLDKEVGLHDIAYKE